MFKSYYVILLNNKRSKGV